MTAGDDKRPQPAAEAMQERDGKRRPAGKRHFDRAIEEDRDAVRGADQRKPGRFLTK